MQVNSDEFIVAGTAQSKATAPIEDYSKLTFHGWRRNNGRVGVRNHVVLLPLDDLSNTACEAVANNVRGTLAIPHAYGRLQFGEDLELYFRTLIGTGSNPNVAAVVVIGIEDGWTKTIVDGIAKTGKPVAGFGIEGHGDIATVAKASYIAKQYVQGASELRREECAIHELWVSTKCGESDTTTGLSSCPTVGAMYDKLIPCGIYGVFGETPRSPVPSISAKREPSRMRLAKNGLQCGKRISTTLSRLTRQMIYLIVNRLRAIFWVD